MTSGLFMSLCLHRSRELFTPSQFLSAFIGSSISSYNVVQYSMFSLDSDASVMRVMRVMRVLFIDSFIAVL